MAAEQSLDNIRTEDDLMTSVHYSYPDVINTKPCSQVLHPSPIPNYRCLKIEGIYKYGLKVTLHGYIILRFCISIACLNLQGTELQGLITKTKNTTPTIL